MDGTLQLSSEQNTKTNRGRYTRGRDRPGCQPDLPGKEEIIAAIKSLKNEKSPRQNNLSAEVFKADPQLAVDLLFTDIWEGKNHLKIGQRESL